MTLSAIDTPPDLRTLTLMQRETLYTGTVRRAHQERSDMLARSLSRLASMFRSKRNLAGIFVVLAAIVGASAATSGARADDGKFKIRHSVSGMVTQNGPVQAHGRAAPMPGGFKAAQKIPSLVDRVQPRVQGKIDCLVGCKPKPILYQHKKFPCKIVGCKPGKDHDGHHHGHHHDHHKHGSWQWGGVTVVASDHGGCGYEFWKWKMTGWRFWKHAYLSCRGWE
jgi:hypothetical protein